MKVACRWLVGNMTHNLKSLKGGYAGDYVGNCYIGIIKGDTTSSDYGSCERIGATICE